jgi:hypothetical protein
VRRRIPHIDGDGDAQSGISTVFPERLRSCYYKSRRSGFVPLLQADRFAIFLGMHPTEIWGDAWWWV